MTAFHRAEQRNDVEMIYCVRYPDGREECRVMAWTLRYFFRYEVERLLARSGFRITALYGNFDRSPPSDKSPDMIFVAQTHRAGMVACGAQHAAPLLTLSSVFATT